MNDTKTLAQVSAGGVAFRRREGAIEVVIVSVGDNRHWQLPKGLVDKGESTESAAIREVREEGGIAAELINPIDTIEYWYYSTKGGRRVRYHKYVHFFLMRYMEGNVEEHDQEVHEARWVSIDAAIEMLRFKSERSVVKRAGEMIAELQ